MEEGEISFVTDGAFLEVTTSELKNTALLSFAVSARTITTIVTQAIAAKNKIKLQCEVLVMCIR